MIIDIVEVLRKSFKDKTIGMSFREMESKVNVPSATLNRFINNQNTPDLVTLDKIAKFCGEEIILKPKI